MTALEVVLLICGLICVIVSFIMGDKDEKINANAITSDLTEEQKNNIRKQINDIADEEIQNINEKTEASLDKISNTKILEMNEYAETIMDEINRNHNETVFLYDMLNEKAKEVKSTVKDVNITKKQVEKIQSEVNENSSKDKSALMGENEDNTIDSSPDAKSDSSIRETKDVAKERLAELVKQSNERVRTSEGTKKRNKQAGGLNDIVNEAKSDNKEKADELENAAKNGLSAASKTAKSRSNNKSKKSETVKANIQFDKNANNNDKILEMHSQGLSNLEIAKQMGLGIGEVKLVIDLYNSAN